MQLSTLSTYPKMNPLQTGGQRQVPALVFGPKLCQSIMWGSAVLAPATVLAAATVASNSGGKLLEPGSILGLATHVNYFVIKNRLLSPNKILTFFCGGDLNFDLGRPRLVRYVLRQRQTGIMFATIRPTRTLADGISRRFIANVIHRQP